VFCLNPSASAISGRAHALRSKAHQQAKDGQAAGMAEGSKGMGGAILFHISRL